MVTDPGSRDEQWDQEIEKMLQADESQCVRSGAGSATWQCESILSSDSDAHGVSNVLTLRPDQLWLRSRKRSPDSDEGVGPVRATGL